MQTADLAGRRSEMGEAKGQGPVRRRDQAIQYLRQHVARELGAGAAELPGDRPLVALGLDSLAAAELAAAIEADLGVRLDLSELLEGLTLDDLAARIAAAGGERCAAPAGDAAATAEGAAVAALERAAVAPEHSAVAPGGAVGPPEGEAEEPGEELSWGQRALWLVDRMAPGNAAYVIAGAARVRGELDVARLRRAVAGLAARHAVLRARLVERGETVVQVGAAGAGYDWRELAAPAEPAGDGGSAAAVVAALGREAYAPFDLAAGPLLRAVWFDRGDGAAPVVALAVHHLVADFGSLGVMLRDLAALYDGRTPPPIAGSYGDFVAWQEALLAGAEGARLRAYWHGVLRGAGGEGLPVLALPADRGRPAVASYRGGVRRLRLPGRVGEGLGEIARRAGATRFMVLLAGYMALLHRHSGQTDIVVGTPAAGRGGAAHAELVGYLVQPLAMRVAFDADAGVARAAGAGAAGGARRLRASGLPLRAAGRGHRR
jgi:acyl carrier protein